MIDPPPAGSRLPLVPTVIVLAAVAVMIWLGFWQLGRLHEKEALLARYTQAQAMSAEIDWPSDKAAPRDLLYRQARLMCRAIAGRSSMAGRNARGEPGVAQTARCVLPGGGTALVVLGWSRQPGGATNWQGGEVRGIIAPGPRLVAEPPVAGLQANAIPDPSEIPNNHLSYAIQWFFFAATAVVIYVLALNKRNRR
ncbi:MAG TPA: SURF1 family protein [Novosphingobium sp.]|nr:SURF1 family protein [Novosphingobium sp.]